MQFVLQDVKSFTRFLYVPCRHARTTVNTVKIDLSTSYSLCFYVFLLLAVIYITVPHCTTQPSVQFFCILFWLLFKAIIIITCSLY